MASTKQKKPRLDSDDIEGIAIRQIEEFFERSTVVKTFLAKTDKGPFWDGYLYIYKNGHKVNENFIGAIKIQSKGKTVAAFSKDKFSYPIRKVDLEAYKKEGTLYFVTQISETGKKLFYRELTPSLIANILRAHKGVEKPSVVMNAVPEDRELVEQRLSVFKKDCEQQTTAIATNAKPYTFQDLLEKGIKQLSFTVPTKPVKETSLPEYLVTNEVYLYADMDPEHHTIVPIGDGPVTMQFKKVIKGSVSIANKVYFESYESELTKDGLCIRIGGFLDISFPEFRNIRNAKLHYKRSASTLRESIREAEFILEMTKQRSISINGQTYKIREKKTPKRYKEILPKWKELDGVLNKIGLRKDINIESLSEDDQRKLDIVVDAIGHGNKIRLKDVETSILDFEVSNVHLLLWCFVDEESMCSMGSFFDDVKVSYKFSNDQRLPASLFSWLKVEHWVNIDNIAYDRQLESYKNLVIENPYIYEMACVDCLNMMKAMDAMVPTDEKYQLTAKNLQDILYWLFENDKDNTTTYQLNKLQLHKRLNSFNDEDISVAINIMQDESTEPSFRAEAAVLLNNEAACLNMIECMEPDLCERFATDPISRWFTEIIKNTLEHKCGYPK